MESKIMSEAPISLTALKEEIAKVKKQDKEPSIRVTKVEDYLNSMAPLSTAKEKELVEAIKKLDVPRLREPHLAKISDMIPRTADELKIILQGYSISISNENIKKIVDAVNKTLG